MSLVGWRWGFVLFAALGVAWCIVFAMWFRDRPSEHRGVNAAELELIETTRGVIVEHGSLQRNWLAILLKPQVALLGVQYFFCSFVWYFYITWLPTYLREARGQTAGRAAFLSVLPLLFGGVGSLMSGLLPLRISRRAIAFFGFLSTSLLLLVFPHITSVVLAMVCLGMASFSSDLAMPISWNACVEIGGSYTATVAATMNMLGNLAGFVAPAVGGLILQKTAGNWNPLIYLMAGAAALAASCWILLNPDQHGVTTPLPSDPALLTVEGAAL